MRLEKVKPDYNLAFREKSEFYSGHNRKSQKDFKQKRHHLSILFVLFSFDVLFLIDIFIEIIVDLLAVF